jgi:hypothetical protein
MRANTSAVVKPSWLGSIVLHVLGTILSILFFLVIVVLSLTTSVPAWVWIPLAVADLLLIILQFRLKPAGRGVGVGVAGVILVTVIAIVSSQVFAATPAILGEDGRLLPGSIATWRK